eukprot:gene12840-biopygen2437
MFYPRCTQCARRAGHAERIRCIGMPGTLTNSVGALCARRNAPDDNHKHSNVGTAKGTVWSPLLEWRPSGITFAGLRNKAQGGVNSHCDRVVSVVLHHLNLVTCRSRQPKIGAISFSPLHVAVKGWECMLPALFSPGWQFHLGSHPVQRDLADNGIRAERGTRRPGAMPVSPILNIAPVHCTSPDFEIQYRSCRSHWRVADTAGGHSGQAM